MKKKCELCGRTESETMADARSLGLQEEFQSGTYTCCQISEWSDEQLLAWFEAAHADGECAEYVPPGQTEAQSVFVYVRAKRPQVPWYRNPENRS